MKNKLKLVASQAERQLILATLAQTNNSKSKTAEILGIDRKTLYNKMRDLKIHAT